MVLLVSLAAASVTQAALWNSTAAMKTTRGAAGVLEVDGRLYVIGGVDGWRFLNTSEFTTVQPDGALAGGACVGRGSRLFWHSVERTKIQADGSLGA